MWGALRGIKTGDFRAFITVTSLNVNLDWDLHPQSTAVKRYCYDILDLVHLRVKSCSRENLSTDKKWYLFKSHLLRSSELWMFSYLSTRASLKRKTRTPARWAEVMLILNQFSRRLPPLLWGNLGPGDYSELQICTSIYVDYLVTTLPFVLQGQHPTSPWAIMPGCVAFLSTYTGKNQCQKI